MHGVSVNRPDLKIAIVGGGSSYTPELVRGLLDRTQTLPVRELWLMDTSGSRLSIVGDYAQRMVAARENPFCVRLCSDRREALRDADYVITQIRVGGMQARCRDEYLGRRHGLIGQETTGIGGFSKALRTIPVILDIACDMAEVAPGALLVNFANPAGLITEALARYAPFVPSVGLCNVAITTKMEILTKLVPQEDQPVDPRLAELDTLGLNHLTWHRGLVVDGRNWWPTVFQRYLDDLRDTDKPEWPPRLIESLGMIPNYYLHYYYDTAHRLTEQERWPPSRAEEVMAIEQDLLAAYRRSDRTELPARLMQRGGAYYSTASTRLIDAHCNNRGEVHVVNVPHRGAVNGWPEDWVLEMPCRVDRDGIHPIPAHPLPPACSGLIAHVKAFELLAVDAAVHGDCDAAYQALLAHPLGPSPTLAQAVWEDILATHRSYLPQFKARNRISGKADQKSQAAVSSVLIQARVEGYFLGIDVGGSKSQALVADGEGHALALAQAGAGNYESVGWQGLANTLSQVTSKVLGAAALDWSEIRAAGYGIAGYDWPGEEQQTRHAIESLSPDTDYVLTNDAIIGLKAGTELGWGIAVVAGTSNNCRGYDREGREGRVTGEGARFGEYGGASEMVAEGIQAVSRAWSQRGPATLLSQAFITQVGAESESDLLEGLALGQYRLSAGDVPLIFQAAAEGDLVAQSIVYWAGCELGDLAIGVIRQLDLVNQAFDVILVGSLYDGSPSLQAAMETTIHRVAHQARLVRLDTPPVTGAVLLAMEQKGLPTSTRKPTLLRTTRALVLKRNQDQHIHGI